MKKQEIVELWEYLSRDFTDSLKGEVLVPSGRNGSFNTRDYIAACAYVSTFNKYNPNFDFSGIEHKDTVQVLIPAAERFRLHYYTPCLAARYDELKSNQQNELFDSRRWVATEKCNGARGWLVITREGMKLFSRNYSDVDCSLLEYSNNIAQHLNIDKFQDTVAIDVEVVFEPSVQLTDDILQEFGLVTASPLEAMVALLHLDSEKAIVIQEQYKQKYGHDLVAFRMIAPLYYNRFNYIKSTLGKGIDDYDEVLAYVQSLGFNVRPIEHCDGDRVAKEMFLNSILSRGGEGVVFHNRDGEYCTSENRSKQSYIKLKRTISATVGKDGMGDTIDAFVTDFQLGNEDTINAGLVTTLEFSIYVNDNGNLYKKFIGAVGALDMATKKQLTVVDGGLFQKPWISPDGIRHFIGLNPDFVERVAEIQGQALSSKNQRLEHPRLIRWRSERDSSSCIYTKEWLDSQTTGDGIKYSGK